MAKEENSKDQIIEDQLNKLRAPVHYAQPGSKAVDNAVVSPNPAPEKSKKKKVGRPKTKHGTYRTINIAVPEEMMGDIKIAACQYGNNLTAYINDLIKKDLAANLEKYKKDQTIQHYLKDATIEQYDKIQAILNS